MEKRFEVIEEILNKLSLLSNQNLAEVLERANDLIEDNDPKASLTKSREALEGILHDVYVREMKEEPKRIELGFMLNNNQFTRKVETRILKYINMVRDMGNMGPHSIQGKVEGKDAVRVLDCLVDIINWYLDRYYNLLEIESNLDTDLGNEFEKEYQLGEDFKQKGELITALLHYSNAAEHGHKEAQYQMGMAYKEGNGIYQDLQEAYKWFEMASQSGHINSLFEIGTYCYYRTDGHKDDKKALKYLSSAAKGGHPDSQILIGTMYRDGKGTNRNIIKSINWFKEAAEKHMNAEAYLYLAEIYEDGKYIEKNEKIAFQMYWRATNLDNVEAMFRLGIMCFEGRGTERNPNQALYMFEKASEYGHEDASKWYDKASLGSSESDIINQTEDLSSTNDNITDPEQKIEFGEIYRKVALEVNSETKYKNGQEILEDVLATPAVIIERRTKHRSI